MATPALTVISLLADRVSVASPPAVLLILLATVMLPDWVLAPAEAVVIVTEVPALSAVSILPVVTMAVSSLR